MAKREKTNVPHPSSEQVEHYLRAWDELENYHLQEDALDKLFFTLCPENSDMLSSPFSPVMRFSRSDIDELRPVGSVQVSV